MKNQFHIVTHQSGVEVQLISNNVVISSFPFDDEDQANCFIQGFREGIYRAISNIQDFTCIPVNYNN